MLAVQNSRFVRNLICLALEEDLSGGDLTSEILIDPTHMSSGEILAREELVVCGTEILPVIFEEAGHEVSVAVSLADGSRAKPNDIIACVQGATRTLLALERTVLNFLQRLSGVATYTREIVDAAHGIEVLDTRKTTPGWRALEKYAVLVGGGLNHRMSLSDMIMIKDNHIDACGESVEDILRKVQERKPQGIAVEIEVRNLKELKEALRSECDMIMLDNMGQQQLVAALEEIARSPRSPRVEISGGITKERFPELRAAGVGLVSMGSLTTQARNVDISMNLISNTPAVES